MSSSKKELAKFACGAETFHAFVHAYFWYSRTTLKVAGIEETPRVHLAAALGNAVVALALGVYAWRAPPRDGVENATRAVAEEPNKTTSAAP